MHVNACFFLKVYSILFFIENVFCVAHTAQKQFVSGEMHYFRVPYQLWRDRLEKMKFGGINVVSFPINMFVHNPEPGDTYITDIHYLNFLKLIKQLKMEAIVKIGPFIDADLSFGGLQPFRMWQYNELTTEYTWLRDDKNRDYLKMIQNSIKGICISLIQYFAENGGPIIMLQLEQDYGHESGLCITNSRWLQLLEKSIRIDCRYNGTIYVSDLNSRNNLLCGGFSNTLNGTIHLRNVQLDNQLISNYHWNLLKTNLNEIIGAQTPFFVPDIPSGKTLSWHDKPYNPNYNVINNLITEILMSGASFNYYMYVGGTNFGFLSGDSGQFTQGYITAYDNNAPISESGELTKQFFQLREIIEKYTHIKSRPLTKIQMKTLRKYPSIHLEPVGCMLCETVKRKVSKLHPILADSPLTFRELNQTSGFVLYETRLQFQPIPSSVLECTGVADRGYVYFRYVFVGYLNHFTHFQVKLKSPKRGDILQILVEDNGRLSHGFRLNMDVKGITRNVYLDGHELLNWTMYQYPFSFAPPPYISKDVEKLFKYTTSAKTAPLKIRTAMFYRGQFFANDTSDYENSTYIDLSKWGKGVVFLNGINLGRYWSIAGPQINLFVPGVFLFKNKLNVIIVLELERPPFNENFMIDFIDKPVLFKSIKDRRNGLPRRECNDYIIVLFVILDHMYFL